MKKKIFVLCALISCGALFLVGYRFSTSGSTDAYPQNPREWTVEMREQYPNEFLKLAEKALKADLATIDGRLEGLQASAGKIAKRYEDAQKKFAFVEKRAELLVEAKEAGKFPVEILGTKCEERQLQAQMKQVCGELKARQRTLDAVKKASKVLEKQKMDLRLYRTECQGQLDSLDAERAIFRDPCDDPLKLLSECADVLEGSGSYLANLDPVADVETLVKRAEAEAEAEQTDDGEDLDLEALLKESRVDEDAPLEASPVE